MSDDVDDLLRRAMASLDRQVGSGYFDALPERTLARLDDPAIGEAPDDSGLKDIHDLASETRARLASRRAQGSPGARPGDDVVAASSASWQAIALPEAEAPPAVEARGGAGAGASPAQPGAAGAGLRSAAAPVVALASRTPPGRGPAGRAGRTAAVVGVALAAAAGAVLLVTARGADRAEPRAGVSAVATSAPSRESPRAPAANTAQPWAASAGSGAARSGAPPDPIGAATGAAAVAPAPAPSIPASKAAPGEDPGGSSRDALGKFVAPPAKPSVGKRSGAKGATDRPESRTEADLGAQEPAAGSSGAADQVARPDGGKPVAGGSGSGSEQPPLDQLIGEPDIPVKRPGKSKLGQTPLSVDDIKRGMTAIAARVQACRAGTVGAASLRVTVAASGQVTRVVVSGPFAGTPVATCIERAVAAARFPPWDGGARSFGYSYLLSD